ncbi:MAG: EAL domain-containing protein [Pseudomonadota bacterium]|nr:EAL domain-containing protein [Pseudomonadota bacterium]
MAPSSKNFNLPWHQHQQYWIAIYPAGDFTAPVQAALAKAGLKAAGDGLAVQAARHWKPKWDEVYQILSQAGATDGVEVAVVPSLDPAEGIPIARRTVAAMQKVSESLWLGDALLEERIVCYLQPVLVQPDKVFGYESFARVHAPDGSVISGDRIIAAARALGIEYTIDRRLQVQAIQTFMASSFDGFLFVNFLPGFIHRPAVYLEDLSETVKYFGIAPRHIVLDFKAETPRDVAQLRNVCEYGRMRGYSVALDDIASVDGAKKLMAEIRPDFVKIDMQLVRHVAEAGARQTIRSIVDLVHGAGGSAIGEGVETEEIYQLLRALNVDLFQGYYFSPPMPVEKALKKAIS